MKRRPNIRKTFTIDSSNWANGKYDQSTGILRMDPGDTLRLIYSWNFVDDNGIDVRTQEFFYVPDSTCNGRMIAAQEIFVFHANLTVFDRVPELLTGPYEFTMCHVNAYVSPQFCPPILEDKPETYCPNVPLRP
jgi:hypothetical protein